MASAFDRFLKLQVIPPLVVALVRLLGLSWRFRTVGWKRTARFLAGGDPVVGLILHGRQPCVAHYMSCHGRGPWTILCSKSVDGEMQNRILSMLGHRTVRGSSGRDGASALVSLLRERKQGNTRLVLAVDGGGKGPCYTVKPGALFICQKSGAWAIPLAAAAQNALVFKRSWDRMHLPRPFDTVVLVFGRPIQVPANLSDQGFDRLRQGTEELLRRMRLRAEGLAKSRHV